MTVREKQIFSKGQLRSSLVLTPRGLSLRKRILLAGVALLFYGAAGFLWTCPGELGELIICCSMFGSFALLWAIFKPSYEVIQENEVRLRLSLGPISIIGKRTPLHLEFPYRVGLNETKEIIIFANEGSSHQLEIGPFDSKEQATAVLERFRYLDLSEGRHQEARTTRARQEVKDLTLNTRPGLLRFYQVTAVGVVVLMGLRHSDFHSAVIAIICLLGVIILTEIGVVSSTNTEEIGSDHLQVKFSKRFRYFWVDTYSMNPLDPENATYLGRSFNWRVYIPIILFFVGSLTLLISSASATARKHKRPTTPRKATTSQQENEDRRRGIELLNEAKRLRDSRKKEEGERPEPTDP